MLLQNKRSVQRGPRNVSEGVAACIVLMAGTAGAALLLASGCCSALVVASSPPTPANSPACSCVPGSQEPVMPRRPAKPQAHTPNWFNPVVTL